MRTTLLGAAAWLVTAPLFAMPNAAAQSVDDSAFAVGTLTRAEGALGPDLWAGAEAEAVGRLLAALPNRYAEPAYLDLARRVLLSPGQGPSGADNALAGEKLLAAARLGFYREAGELAELAPGLSREPALSKVSAIASLLDGDVPGACARGAGLRAGRADAFFLKLRFVCYVETGESEAADLTLGLMRDQAILTEGDERVFTALATSGSLGSSVSPEDAFQYAAADMLGAQVSEAALSEVPGGVLAAVARDADAPEPLRLAALERALAYGVIGASEGRALAGQLATTALAEDVVLLAAAPRGASAEALALAEALRGAPDWPGFRARVALVAPQLGRAASQATPEDAPILLLAAITAGLGEASDTLARIAAQDPNGDPARLDALRRLAADILVADGEPLPPAPLADRLAASGASVPGLVEGALSAAAARSEGTAALAALVGLGVDAEGEAEDIRAALVADMLERSGQAAAVERRRALDERGAALLGAGGTANNDEAMRDTSGEPTPRLKPRRG